MYTIVVFLRLCGILNLQKPQTVYVPQTAGLTLWGFPLEATHVSCLQPSREKALLSHGLIPKIGC